MMLTDPVHINFHCPPVDPLGKDFVIGKLRFLPDHVDLSWRMKGNVFTGGKSEMTTIDLPYGEIEHVELVKKWWQIRKLIFRVSDPRLFGDIPVADMGKLEMEIDDRSHEEAEKLSSLIDFKRSIFLLDAQEERLKAMREE
ncbi:MAG: hypothetical protein QNK82_07830 [Akkermansiaceae bacterium]|mgnify:CR=1 FL=1|jgi:hypothetical protein|tara:strand:+ start:6409 stop:6831 length:423 start_codon:yes stop_codon:yes gene_type:complete